MSRSIGFVVFALLISACGSVATTDVQAQWCSTHAPELLIAVETDSQSEVNRLIKNAAIARIAHRLRAETEFLSDNFDNRNDNTLDVMRQLETYAEASESGFIGYDPAAWERLLADEAKYNASCASAYEAHLALVDVE